jgi:hypothetical protein
LADASALLRDDMTSSIAWRDHSNHSVIDIKWLTPFYPQQVSPRIQADAVTT